ncbi:hypothetical protein A9G11_04400 [Gilliamella sp. wkB108]|nr:hypothetical protein A9G11_04400 [Gilliamella apicola]
MLRESFLDNKQITLKEIAKLAGVSTSTASRALDERFDNYNSKIAKNIREIAEKHGYIRNIIASNLRRGTTRTIGVLVPYLSDTVMALLYENIANIAERHNYFTVVATAGNSKEREREVIKSLLDRKVDALILATCSLDDENIASLRRNKIPHSLILRTDGQSYSSIGDDKAGAYIATKHLIDLGHKKIALINGPIKSSNSKYRQEGFIEAMKTSNLKLNKDWIINLGFDIKSGEKSGDILFSSKKERPTAIFATNDELAIGVMSSAYNHGIAIGKDVSIIGYGDIPLSSRLPIPLTTIQIPFEYMAERAFNLAINNQGHYPLINMVTPTLISRKSTSKI